MLTAETDRQDLLRILTNLYRRALNDYRERGLHILHLALGILEWRDEEDEVSRAPILLLPVKLERHSLKDPFQLRSLEEEPIVNPALAARLKQDFDFGLPHAPADWDEKTPEQYLDEVKSAVSGLPGWSVQPSVILTLFPFFKGAIFQDLHDNADKIQAHPILQTLAGAAGLLPKTQPLQENELDAQEDPQKVYHILDADGSQRLCLDAAAQGESFVLIGPPGTGKSQTIANLIADRIAHGKKVLFVSEKMAALEVVYKRLCNVGLGEFCLELHSHKANKREVVKELARCFQETLPPQPTPSADDFERLKQRQTQLNQHVQALHQVRQPMNRSVWDALAELPRWQDLPMVSLGLPAVRPAGDTTIKKALSEFEPRDLDELQQLLQRLQHHWHIRTDPNYPWRGFKAERYSLQLRDEVVGLIDKVRGRDEKLRAAAEQYAQRIGVRGKIPDLLRLADMLEKRPPYTAASWLTVSDLMKVSADFEKCADQYRTLGQARKPLTERYGPALWKQPSGTAAKIEQAWKSTATLLAPGDERGADYLKQQQKLRAWAAETQKRIPGWLTELRAIEKWLAVPLPVGAGSTASTSAGEMKLDPSVDSLRAFVRLANLCASDLPVEKAWLDDRALLKDALAHIAEFKPAFVRHKQNRQYLLKIYEEKLFKLDLARIGQAYAGPYQSWLCLFSWRYRKDRRAIAKCRPHEDVPKTVVHDMQFGAELQADRRRIESVQAQASRLLGRYHKALDTDIEAAEKAAKHADEALELAGQLDCERLPAKCVEALVANAPAEKIRAAIKRLNESFVAWTHLTQELQTDPADGSVARRRRSV